MFAAQEQGNKESCAVCCKLDPIQSVKEIIQPRVARSPNAGKEMCGLDASSRQREKSSWQSEWECK